MRNASGSHLCHFKKKDGSLCEREVASGHKYCWQHTEGYKPKKKESKELKKLVKKIRQSGGVKKRKRTKKITYGGGGGGKGGGGRRGGGGMRRRVASHPVQPTTTSITQANMIAPPTSTSQALPKILQPSAFEEARQAPNPESEAFHRGKEPGDSEVSVFHRSIDDGEIHVNPFRPTPLNPPRGEKMEIEKWKPQKMKRTNEEMDREVDDWYARLGQGHARLPAAEKRKLEYNHPGTLTLESALKNFEERKKKTPKITTNTNEPVFPPMLKGPSKTAIGQIEYVKPPSLKPVEAQRITAAYNPSEEDRMPWLKPIQEKPPPSNMHQATERYAPPVISKDISPPKYRERRALERSTTPPPSPRPAPPRASTPPIRIRTPKEKRPREEREDEGMGMGMGNKKYKERELDEDMPQFKAPKPFRDLTRTPSAKRIRPVDMSQRPPGFADIKRMKMTPERDEMIEIDKEPTPRDLELRRERMKKKRQRREESAKEQLESRKLAPIPTEEEMAEKQSKPMELEDKTPKMMALTHKPSRPKSAARMRKTEVSKPSLLKERTPFEDREMIKSWKKKALENSQIRKESIARKKAQAGRVATIEDVPSPVRSPRTPPRNEMMAIEYKPEAKKRDLSSFRQSVKAAVEERKKRKGSGENMIHFPLPEVGEKNKLPPLPLPQPRVKKSSFDKAAIIAKTREKVMNAFPGEYPIQPYSSSSLSSSSSSSAPMEKFDKAKMIAKTQAKYKKLYPHEFREETPVRKNVSLYSKMNGKTPAEKKAISTKRKSYERQLGYFNREPEPGEYDFKNVKEKFKPLTMGFRNQKQWEEYQGTKKAMGARLGGADAIKAALEEMEKKKEKKKKTSDDVRKAKKMFGSLK